MHLSIYNCMDINVVIKVWNWDFYKLTEVQMVVFLQTHLFGIPLFKEYCYYSTFSFSEFSFSGYFCIKWVVLCMRCVAGFIIFQTNFPVINKLLPVIFGSKLLQNKSEMAWNCLIMKTIIQLSAGLLYICM